jgi:uncharacterized Rossmann fold enzyme
MRMQLSVSKVVADLGFSRENDYWAAQIAEIAAAEFNTYRVLEELEMLIKGRTALVVGAGPSCRICSSLEGDVILAADGASLCCLDSGIRPDIVVTDLDGIEMKDIVKLASLGSFFAVHAHGDNVNRFVSALPYLPRDRTIFTVQFPGFSRAVSCIGFTDGDRAVGLALFLGASKILLAGFDFGDVIGPYSKTRKVSNYFATPMKIRKLNWARYLLRELAYGGAAINALSDG